MTKPTLLVTGGSGMVGRNLRECSAALAFRVLAPSRSELDLLDEQATREYLELHRPDVIVHAAGRVGGIQANIANPVAFLLENTRMGLNLVASAYQLGVPRLLNLASSCMYPRKGANPLTESQILTGELEPTNEGYALAKIVSTRLCEYISVTTPEHAYKTLVPCNLYGRFDSFGQAVSHMIPAIIHKLHQAKTLGGDAVEIWGDGTVRREFMYAGDLADAVFFALEHYDALPQNANVGLGHDYTVNEYYEAAAEVIGYEGGFNHDLTKPVGMKQKLVNVDRMTSLGWTAKTSLRDGLRQAYNYYLENAHD